MIARFILAGALALCGVALLAGPSQALDTEDGVYPLRHDLSYETSTVLTAETGTALLFSDQFSTVRLTAQEVEEIPEDFSWERAIPPIATALLGPILSAIAAFVAVQVSLRSNRKEISATLRAADRERRRAAISGLHEAATTAFSTGIAAQRALDHPEPEPLDLEKAPSVRMPLDIARLQRASSFFPDDEELLKNARIVMNALTPISRGAAEKAEVNKALIAAAPALNKLADRVFDLLKAVSREEESDISTLGRGKIALPNVDAGRRP